jgi:hypothetical protein
MEKMSSFLRCRLAEMNIVSLYHKKPLKFASVAVIEVDAVIICMNVWKRFEIRIRVI